MPRQHGFTLIELLLVLAIIGIISAIAIPALLGQRERARATAVKDNVVAIVGDLASTVEGLGDHPSERAPGMATTLYPISSSGNHQKASDAIIYVLAKINFSSAKNPYSSGAAYLASPPGTVMGAVYLDASTANRMSDPVITITAQYTNANGTTGSYVKTIPLN